MMPDAWFKRHRLSRTVAYVLVVLVAAFGVFWADLAARDAQDAADDVAEIRDRRAKDLEATITLICRRVDESEAILSGLISGILVLPDDADEGDDSLIRRQLERAQQRLDAPSRNCRDLDYSPSADD